MNEIQAYPLAVVDGEGKGLKMVTLAGFVLIGIGFGLGYVTCDWWNNKDHDHDCSDRDSY